MQLSIFDVSHKYLCYKLQNTEKILNETLNYIIL